MHTEYDSNKFACKFYEGSPYWLPVFYTLIKYELLSILNLALSDALAGVIY